MNISNLTAIEILDSRGTPTLKITLTTDTGEQTTASVPSGASTGRYEAHELRDNDLTRYGGRGVSQAVTYIQTEIVSALKGMSVSDQSAIDRVLIELDGTPDKSRLGANAILGVSMTVSRAGALALDIPLYQYIAKLARTTPRLPRPCFNVINGGVHAGNTLGVQECMISPHAKTCTEQIRIGSEIYHALKEHLKNTYGGSATMLGDEGGFAPPLNTVEEALGILNEVIEQTSYTGTVEYALDVAASECYTDPMYNLNFKQKNSSPQDSKALLEYYKTLVSRYPIFSIEDPFDQDAFEDFAALRAHLEPLGVRTVGDDLTVTNPDRIERAYHMGSCDTLLLKINQIGTITEALASFALARSYTWQIMVSHRSGETTDDYIADFACGIGAEYLKSGAPARGERVIKYNRLIEIEQELLHAHG